MKEVPKKEFIYYRESALQSIVADISTFGIILGSFWIGHTYLGGNGWAMFFLFLMAMFAIIAKANSKKVTFTSREELLKHINETV